MVYRIIQWWATFFLRLYFRRTIVYGLEHVPRTGPLIVASNHPSAFMEASILGTVIRRPLHFLVRGDMFNPKFQWLFDWTNQIPIFRQKDGIGNLRKNASSFELTYKKLAEHDAVLIFPEAKTVLEKKLRPIQRGTAHLAFGTLPYLKDGDDLKVLPVGVNFMDPRIPGTDVVIRFGPAFVTEEATREDRKAIDRFTTKLEDAMKPLVVQMPDNAQERDYDVLASIYLRCGLAHPEAGVLQNHLISISESIRPSDSIPAIVSGAHQYRKDLEAGLLKSAIYFPDLICNHRLILLIRLVMKCIWLVSGGWLWRLTRSIIFSKIKKNTFQSPVAVGAAMVLYPLIALLFFIIGLLLGWPLWVVPLWMLIMVSGIFVRPPIALIFKVLMLPPKEKRKLKKSILELKKEIVKVI